MNMNGEPMSNEEKDNIEFKLLGNKLAANDKETRDKTVKALVKYLANKVDLVSID